MSIGQKLYMNDGTSFTIIAIQNKLNNQHKQELKYRLKQEGKHNLRWDVFKSRIDQLISAELLFV